MTKTTKCDNCNKRVPSEPLQGEGYPDNGLEIFPLIFGYYGGFLDNFPTDEDKPAGDRVVFCHDCSVALFRQFPSLLGGLDPTLPSDNTGATVYGLHPCEGETPCCEFAWQSASIHGKIKAVNREKMEWEMLDISEIV